MKELEVQGRERRNEAMEAVQRENEELKEVLSAVQIDLESKTEVTVHHRPCYYVAKFSSCGVAIFKFHVNL